MIISMKHSKNVGLQYIYFLESHKNWRYDELSSKDCMALKNLNHDVQNIRNLIQNHNFSSKTQ